MRRHVITSLLYTAITTILFGLLYPGLITIVAQVLFRDKANGQLITQNGVLVGSKLIGQSFSGPRYFHSRPSAAGSGYDASSSGGSNLGPTSKKLLERIAASVTAEQAGASTQEVPVDLVTASASGLDPDITPAAAAYQVPRVAQERHLPESTLSSLVARHTTGRQFAVLGEPRVNVLELNRELDQIAPSGK